MKSRALAAQQSPAEQALTLLDWVHDSAAEDGGYVCIAHNVPLWQQSSEDSDQWLPGDFKQLFYRWPQDRQRIPDGLFNSTFSPNLAQSREVWFSVCAFPGRPGVDPDEASLGWRAQRQAELSQPTRIVWCDIDHAADNWTPDQLTDIDEWVTKRGGAVVRSGSGENRHIYLKLDRPVTREVTERLNLQLAAKFNGDTSKANTSSVLRLPGSFNHKRPEPSPVRLVVAPDPTHPGLAPDELAAELPEPAKTSAPPLLGEFAQCLYEDGTQYGLAALKGELSKLAATSGERNRAIYETAARLGNLVAGGELGREYAWDLLLRVALEIGDNPDLDEGTARRGFNKGLKQPCNAPQLTEADRVALRFQLERWHAKRAALTPPEKRSLTTPDDDHLPAPWWEGPYDQVASLAQEDGGYTKVLVKELFWTVARDYLNGARAQYLLSLPAEEFEQHPYVQAGVVNETIRELGKRKAQLALTPGNKVLGRPSRRSDCVQVVYDTTAPGLFLQPGWVTLFMADYEVGKTMLAYSLAAERLRRGEEVVVIQEDESADQTWGKIDAFCLTPEEEARFQPYNYPGWNLVGTPEMLDQLMEQHPGTTLLVIDSVMKIIKLAGLEEDNPGAVALWTIVERFIAKYPQVAVLLIDHQGHGGNGHARGATGKAQMSSIVVQVSSVTKFAKDRNGQIKAKIHKHRNGESTGHTWRGDVIVRDGDAPLRVEWTDEGVAPQSGGKTAEAGSDPSGLSGPDIGLLRFLKPTLESEDKWVTKTEVDVFDTRHATTVTRSLAKLIQAGYVTEKPGWKPSGGPKAYRRLK